MNDAAPIARVPILSAMRPAFTLVELMVAIAVLTVGVLALAATAGLVASQVGDGGQLTTAAHLARTILDSLATSDCATLTSASTRRGGTTAQWIVTRDTTAARVTVSVSSTLRRRARRDEYEVLIPCVRQ